MMSIEEPSSAAALMMLQHSPTPRNYNNNNNMKAKAQMSEMSAIDTTNHSSNRMVSLHQGVTPRLTQLDDNSFPMSTVSPLFRNDMSPAAPRFRNRSGFKQQELAVATTQESHQKKSLKRTAMSPIASRLMQMKEEVKVGT